MLFGDIQSVKSYFDDPINAETNKEDHDRIFFWILESKKSHNIKFNADKFQFRFNETKYIDLIISEKG